MTVKLLTEHVVDQLCVWGAQKKRLIEMAHTSTHTNVYVFRYSFLYIGMYPSSTY